MSKKADFAALVIFVSLVPFQVFAVDRHVSPSGEGEYPTIQAAIDACDIFDSVVLEPGTYTGEGNRDLEFDYWNAITVRGSDPDDPKVAAATIIDCQKKGRGFYFHADDGAQFAIKGLTVINGSAGEYPKYGGAVACDSGSLHITNCVFSGNDNTALYFLYESETYITNSIFNDNAGAIRSYGYNDGYNSLSVINCTITGNVLVSETKTAIEVLSEAKDLINTTLYKEGLPDNAMRELAVIGSELQHMLSLTKMANSGEYSHEQRTIMDAEFQVLIAWIDIFAAESEFEIVRQLTASGLGLDGGLGIVYSLETGGIVYDNNCWVVNSIVWGNSKPQISKLSSDSPGEIDVFYCDVEGGFDGEGNIDADPCFVDPANGDYFLRSDRGRYWPEHEVWVLDDISSACIDASDPEVNPSMEPAPNGGRLNMGAYGNTSKASKSKRDLPGDINEDDIVDILDFAIMAENWLRTATWPKNGLRNVDEAINLLRISMTLALTNSEQFIAMYCDLSSIVNNSMGEDYIMAFNSGIPDFLDSIDATANTINSSRINMLNDSDGVVSVVTGSGLFRMKTFDLTTAGLGIDGLTITDMESAEAALEKVDQAIKKCVQVSMLLQEYRNSLVLIADK